MARGDQLSRQWKIIQCLAASRGGKSVTELASELECHPRSVYRDLDALQAAGFPLYTDRVHGKNKWAVLNATGHQVPIPFSLTELMALYFSRNMLTVLKNTVFHDSLVTLFQKIKTTLPPEYLDYLDRMESNLGVAPKPYKQYHNLKDTIGRISEAITGSRIIEIDYYTMSRKKGSRRKVMPYKIWFFEDSFYLIGACRLREDIRIFALDRIKSLYLTDETFSLPDGLDIDERLSTSFGVFLGDMQTVRIWFSPNAAGYIREKIWHRTQKIHDNPDGSIVFEAEVAGTREIKFWIMRWGADARVLAPASLRTELRIEAETVAGYYQRDAV
jgi:predicted DNA-binding transcriptional regulator YafY